MKNHCELESLDQISPIAAAAVELREKVLGSNSPYQEEHQRIINAALLKRKALIAELESAGLFVLPVKYDSCDVSEDEVFQDLCDRDNGKKLIESIARVKAYSAQQVQKIYHITERHQLGVITIG